MTALRALRDEIAKTGYPAEAIVSQYVFSDVLAASPRDRCVPLAAFTQTPHSYRTAALAVVDADGRDAASIIAEHRALGAPLLFLIDDQTISVWQVKAKGRPRAIAQTLPNELPALFSRNREAWSPLSIHRAKSIGQVEPNYQLDFVDAGLLPAVEGEIHAKLDRLLDETLAETVRLRRKSLGDTGVDDPFLFRTIFRLLAAKVLHDRGHELATRWNSEDIDSVLDAISGYYKLPRLAHERSPLQRATFGAAWDLLRAGISFRNISADDLAFVYENTLVTPETRKHFGTHSTPRQVAEYIVSRLQLWQHDPAGLRVYEPFAGAGVFLIAALRHIRDLLPVEWTDRQRHDFLVRRIAGDEIDAFAREVATLSLILADYPNANGWEVSELDLFKDNHLVERARTASIVLCNPPFEAFSDNERIRYPKAVSRSHAKPMAALSAVLDVQPLALGFVLPRPFIFGRQYEAQRRRLEELYSKIELVSLPDRTFKASVVRSALLIAHEPRRKTAARAVTTLRSSVVSERDRDRFLRTGRVSESRETTRPFTTATDKLWIEELDELWRFLSDHRCLSEVAVVHRGLEWLAGQSDAVSTAPQEGFVRGVHAANTVRQYTLLSDPRWLEARPERLRRAANFKWDLPKVLSNAARLSRGPWCLAAAVDKNGLVASQQLFGIWLKEDASLKMEVLCALLNGPLGNAYVASHSPPDRIRVSAIQNLPIPTTVPEKVTDLVCEYTELLRTQSGLFAIADGARASALLSSIDAAVLKAYDLPPRLERQLLEYFRGAERPTSHHWSHWLPEEFRPAISLHEYLSGDYAKAAQPWVLDVFRPLPENEASLLRDYLGHAEQS